MNNTSKEPRKTRRFSKVFSKDVGFGARHYVVYRNLRNSGMSHDYAYFLADEIIEQLKEQKLL